MAKNFEENQSGVIQRLERCETCGTFRGELLLKDREQPVRVACACSNGRCPRCRRALVTMPFMRSYDDMNGHEWHAPAFSAACALCGPVFLAHYTDFNINER
jgi:hypothetical protein